MTALSPLVLPANAAQSTLNATNNSNGSVSLFFPITSFHEAVNGGDSWDCISVAKLVLNVAYPLIVAVNLLMLPFIAAYNCCFASEAQPAPVTTPQNQPPAAPAGGSNTVLGTLNAANANPDDASEVSEGEEEIEVIDLSEPEGTVVLGRKPRIMTAMILNEAQTMQEEERAREIFKKLFFSPLGFVGIVKNNLGMPGLQSPEYQPLVPYAPLNPGYMYPNTFTRIPQQGATANPEVIDLNIAGQALAERAEYLAEFASEGRLNGPSSRLLKGPEEAPTQLGGVQGLFKSVMKKAEKVKNLGEQFISGQFSDFVRFFVLAAETIAAKRAEDFKKRLLLIESNNANVNTNVTDIVNFVNTLKQLAVFAFVGKVVDNQLEAPIPRTLQITEVSPSVVAAPAPQTAVPAAVDEATVPVTAPASRFEDLDPAFYPTMINLAKTRKNNPVVFATVAQKGSTVERIQAEQLWGDIRLENQLKLLAKYAKKTA